MGGLGEITDGGREVEIMGEGKDEEKGKKDLVGHFPASFSPEKNGGGKKKRGRRENGERREGGRRGDATAVVAAGTAATTARPGGGVSQVANVLKEARRLTVASASCTWLARCGKGYIEGNRLAAASALYVLYTSLLRRVKKPLFTHHD
ncbi:uncharacterized protein G2W53_027184 [Senna tora]|uniref:Uncharacterized protein n=1 Tax=Senna tora TaxID=362788 RepID=A0A834TQD2_9FABA|nr:uncharacterized protein G2W53_027184 [Senna tora]